MGKWDTVYTYLAEIGALSQMVLSLIIRLLLKVRYSIL